MRTVTFSDAEVMAQLKRDFRLAWVNLEGEKSAGASFAHSPADAAGTCTRGVGEHNVQILFATPKGELLHAVAGYLSAEELLEEMELARELAGKIAKIDSERARRKMVQLVQREAWSQDRKLKEDGLFADFKKNRLVRDHEFCRKSALMDIHDFEPTAMVGRGQTFFGSSQGNSKKEQIGRMPKGGQAFDLDEMIRDIEARERKAKPRP